MSALADHLKELISQEGPLTIAAFMSEVLTNPTHGYYTRQDPFGASGDFVTAPEISQTFGEMVGLWLIDAWQRQGSPSSFILCELGPGRGTLMADLLRAARAQPAFLTAAEIHLVEISPALRRKQEAALAAHPQAATWTTSFEHVPSGRPLYIIANEFFDALPIRQFVRGKNVWHERCVGLGDNGRLTFGLIQNCVPDTLIPYALRDAPEGSVFELRSSGETLIQGIAARIAGSDGVALIVDYGHAHRALGDTLQAVHGHVYASPLADPGTADLTAHVDFAALRDAAESHAAVHGPLPQGKFLNRLGINVRGERLAAANPSRKTEILEGILRLTADDQMGSLFKVLALLPKGAPVPAGF